MASHGLCHVAFLGADYVAAYTDSFIFHQTWTLPCGTVIGLFHLNAIHACTLSSGTNEGLFHMAPNTDSFMWHHTDSHRALQTDTITWRIMESVTWQRLKCGNIYGLYHAAPYMLYIQTLSQRPTCGKDSVTRHLWVLSRGILWTLSCGTKQAAFI